MLRHIVAWNFKDGFTAEENQANAIKVKAELEELKQLIPEIVDINVDINLLDSSNRVIMLDSYFENEKTLAAYKVHPEHVRVGDFIGTVLQDTTAIDFYK